MEEKLANSWVTPILGTKTSKDSLLSLNVNINDLLDGLYLL
jgi:hypothetical protein